jgi:hypothetical protein
VCIPFCCIRWHVLGMGFQHAGNFLTMAYATD